MSFLCPQLSCAMSPKATDSHTVSGIIDLHKAGHSVSEISDLKNLSKQTGRHLINKFKDGGEGGDTHA